jgi:hypothetical protein
LAKDDGLGIGANRVVDFRVWYGTFAQTGVGAVVAIGVEVGVFWEDLLWESVLH